MADTTIRKNELISFKTVASVLALSGLVYLVCQIPVQLFILYLAFLIALALYPCIEWLTRKRIPKGLSIATVFIVFAAILGFLIFTVGTILLSQGQQLITHFPDYLKFATAQIKTLPILGHQKFALESAMQKFNGQFSQSYGFLVSSLGYVIGLLTSIFSLFTILIFTYFFLAEGPYFKNIFRDIIPFSCRDCVLTIVNEILDGVGAYVRGQLLVVIISGLVVGIALTLLQVPYAYIQGLLLAFLDMIPVIGPLVALSIGVIITLGSKMALVPWVIAIYLGNQQLENAFVFPTIMRHSLKLHGFWILLSIFICSSVFGVAGILMAVPIAITVRVLFKHFILKPEPA